MCTANYLLFVLPLSTLLAPARVLAMTNAFINGDYATARKLHIDNVSVLDSN
jgi:hypothetical protein